MTSIVSPDYVRASGVAVPEQPRPAFSFYPEPKDGKPGPPGKDGEPGPPGADGLAVLPSIIDLGGAAATTGA